LSIFPSPGSWLRTLTVRPPDLDGVLAKPLLQANLLLVEVFRMEM